MHTAKLELPTTTIYREVLSSRLLVHHTAWVINLLVCCVCSCSIWYKLAASGYCVPAYSKQGQCYLLHFLYTTSCIECYILLKSQIWHASRVLFQAVCAWSTSKYWLVEQWRVISIKCYRSLTSKNLALCDMTTVFYMPSMVVWDFPVAILPLASKCISVSF